jgi:hypothetical protein
MKLKEAQPGDVVRLITGVKARVCKSNETFTTVVYLRKGSNPETKHCWNSDTEVTMIDRAPAFSEPVQTQRSDEECFENIDHE